jgi:L-methionine (R)-S-oxide reductase
LVAKQEAYATARDQLAALLPDCPDLVAAMATVAAVLKHNLDHVLWVGFYLPEPDGSLRVGPYQGPLAGVRLPPGQGVCGAVARSRESLVVPDVAEFEGHIACDPRARSEIVVPVLAGGELRAVLDVDSDRPAAFDEVDRTWLEAITALLV